MKNNILRIINEKYEKYSIGYSKIKCPKSEQIGVRHSDSVARPYRWCKWCGAPRPTTLGGPPARTR